MDEKTPPPIRVNYIYFGLFLTLLILFSGSSVFVRENFSGSRMFFFLYAAGQALTEVSILIFLGWIIQKWFSRDWVYFYIALTFLLLVSHCLDFLTDRILDLSAFETAMVYFLEQPGEQFLYLLDASGVPFWIWGLIFCGLGLIPLIGILFYSATDAIAAKRPLAIRADTFFQILVCLPAALFLWDFSASRVIHPDTYTAFLKSLPWKSTFLPPDSVQIALAGPPQETAENESFSFTPLAEKPNIYLFIVESLREDFITTETAPHLSAFKDEAIHFDMALSNANSTNMAWFSIFHSDFPYLWAERKELGSPALKALKELGYQIHVLSSAQLAYFGMDELIFGKDRHLADSFRPYLHAAPLTAVETDAAVLEQLQKELKNPAMQKGQCFIVFWDSTHFDYSWPKNEPPRFSPVAGELAYFGIFNWKKNLEGIKNRYRNAVHYIDSLFGKFYGTLPNRDEAIVLFLGDHGEEFFERGHLFHGSHLIREQTNIPFYLKFGAKGNRVEKTEAVSQMDLFPSLIDYLTGQELRVLKGESVFRESKWPYAVMARFNASRPPYEIAICNGKHKLIARFSNRRNIFKSDHLQIRSLCSGCDKALSECKEGVHTWVESEFGEALNRLFPATSVREAASGARQSDPRPLSAAAPSR